MRLRYRQQNEFCWYLYAGGLYVGQVVKLANGEFQMSYLTSPADVELVEFDEPPETMKEAKQLLRDALREETEF